MNIKVNNMTYTNCWLTYPLLVDETGKTIAVSSEFTGPVADSALEELKGRELPVSLAVAFTSQEEVGGVGAVNSAYTLHPAMAIAVDVSFALTPDADPLKCGKLGEGPMVGISPILDRRIWKKLIALAEAQSIPFQREVMGGGSTGTNADGIALSRGGVRTGLISLPQRYMHTPIEVVRLCDIEAVGKLLAAYALDPAL